jgi:putative aldouronate transport system substrate-binding protein
VYDPETYIQKFNDDRVGAWTGYGTDAGLTDSQRPWEEIIAVAPPVGPAGVSRSWATNFPFKGNNAAISAKASAETQKKIMEIFNYTYTDEGKLLTNFGAEGVTYDKTPDGGYAYTDVIMKDPENAPLDILRQYGIGSWWPMWEMEEFNPALFGEKYAAAKDIYMGPDVELMMNLSWLPFTTEESAVISAKHAAVIQRHINETFDKIITGALPLDEFDAMVDRVNAMGLADVLQAYNDALVRWNESQ